MELSEIQERIKEVAEELEIDVEDLGDYQLSITIAEDTGECRGIISDIDKSIDINQVEQVIYLTVQLY